MTSHFAVKQGPHLRRCPYREFDLVSLRGREWHVHVDITREREIWMIHSQRDLGRTYLFIAVSEIRVGDRGDSGRIGPCVTGREAAILVVLEPETVAL